MLLLSKRLNKILPIGNIECKPKVIYHHSEMYISTYSFVCVCVWVCVVSFRWILYVLIHKTWSEYAQLTSGNTILVKHGINTTFLCSHSYVSKLCVVVVAVFCSYIRCCYHLIECFDAFFESFSRMNIKWLKWSNNNNKSKMQEEIRMQNNMIFEWE